MRHLSAVIDKMLEIIPSDKTELISDLRSVRESTMYSAPEMLGSWWIKCALILDRNLCEYQNGIPSAPELKNEWERKIVNIWTNQ